MKARTILISSLTLTPLLMLLGVFVIYISIIYASDVTGPRSSFGSSATGSGFGSVSGSKVTEVFTNVSGGVTGTLEAY